MDKFEYITIFFTLDNATDSLNEYGQMGWELISVILFQLGGYHAFLKRNTKNSKGGY